MKQVAGGVYQSDRFFSRQNDRQAARRPGIRHLLDRVRSLQRLAEEETRRRRVQTDSADAQFALLEQVNLIGAKFFFAQLVRWTTEMPGKILHDFQVGVYGSLRVIATLEFLQHHFSKLGHRDLLVTHKISPSEPDGHHFTYA